jgi:hypothetical protein
MKNYVRVWPIFDINLPRLKYRKIILLYFDQQQLNKAKLTNATSKSENFMEIFMKKTNLSKAENFKNFEL